MSESFKQQRELANALRQRLNPFTPEEAPPSDFKSVPPSPSLATPKILNTKLTLVVSNE